jgi:hypothetical protein
MAALGRWGAVDPLADQYAGYSPYNYVLGNPNSLIDPDGRMVAAITAGSSEEFGANWKPLKSDFDRQPETPEWLKKVARAAGDFLRGDRVRQDIARQRFNIHDSSTRWEVDADLIRAILFEETAHRLPLAESDFAEGLGFGNTIGMGQVTVGLNGRTRAELRYPRNNIDAVAQHLSGLKEGGLIDTSRPVASLATRYNCGSCSQISDYGTRVETYYRRYFRRR